MESIARTTGGECLRPDAFPEFIKSKLTRKPPATRETGAVWKSSWNHALIALAIAAFLAAEWFLRRRNGLS